MCVLISAWLCVLLGLLPLEIQSRAVTLQTPPHRHRHLQPLLPDLSPSAPPLSLLSQNLLPEHEAELFWRALLHQEPPHRHHLHHHHHHHQIHTAATEQEEEPVRSQRGSRGRRHVNSVGGRGHLMRVGCVLGTCQVQNLSHRLYQLIGQSGREDSSPINPRSPHSYG